MSKITRDRPAGAPPLDFEGPLGLLPNAHDPANVGASAPLVLPGHGPLSRQQGRARLQSCQKSRDRPAGAPPYDFKGWDSTDPSGSELFLRSVQSGRPTQ